jgi:hypothetical protein
LTPLVRGQKRENFHTKNSRRNLAEKSFRSVSGNGFGCFKRSDLDPVKNRPDLHHSRRNLAKKIFRIESGDGYGTGSGSGNGFR